jgi:hypothetical protein
MSISLYPYQLKALNDLQSGSILCGGVGSGKSRTAIAYFFIKECLGKIKINVKGEMGAPKKPKDLYIITTAKKRDSLEWEKECSPFILSTKKGISISGINVIVDSWNNISKFIDIKNAFFIFDEQRLIGSGTWVKSFLKIVKHNRWILLSATPGDTWSDYIPVFVANGFYKNRTDFIRQHVVYSRFTKYPQIDRYIECGRLIRLRNLITVVMVYKRQTVAHDKFIYCDYNKNLVDKVASTRWNVFKNKPLKTASELCYVLRKIVNQHSSRIKELKEIFKKHSKLIVFYNFDYELEILRNMCHNNNTSFSEWNGHKHETIPNSNAWVYLVQYSSGAEGWNCIETDAIAFYSQNYSYKTMVQSAGRIDRVNTSFKDLYYYHLTSKSNIDSAISQALKKKKKFNVNNFIT